MHLPLEQFTVRRASPDGLGFKCKSCSSAYQKSRYKQDPSLRKRIKEKAKEWAKKNKDRRQEIVSKSSKKHRDKKNDRQKKRNKMLRKLFPEKYKLLRIIAEHKRRSRMKNSGNMPPPEVIKTIISMARGRCVYCGRTDKPLTLDHIQPVSKGGPNTWDNFVPCCKSCNSSKNTRDFDEWLYKCHGVQGLADMFVFLKSVQKAIRRLYPELYLQFCQTIIEKMSEE